MSVRDTTAAPSLSPCRSRPETFHRFEECTHNRWPPTLDDPAQCTVESCTVAGRLLRQQRPSCLSTRVTTLTPEADHAHRCTHSKTPRHAGSLTRKPEHTPQETAENHVTRYADVVITHPFAWPEQHCWHRGFTLGRATPGGRLFSLRGHSGTPHLPCLREVRKMETGDVEGNTTTTGTGPEDSRRGTGGG